MFLKRALGARWAVPAMMVASLAVSAALLAGPAQAGTIPLVDVSLPGPIGGVNLCLDTHCQLLEGIANVHIVESLTSATVTLPAVTFSTQPGCTADVDLQVNITTPGVAGTLTGSISFDQTDKNGVPIPGEHTVIPLGSIPVSVGSLSHSVSLCGAVL